MARLIRAGFLLFAGFLVCAPGYAQTMYRCGNKYQDRPCDAGQKSKAVGSTGVGAAASAPSGDAQCAQRGRDSLKIVWSREGGATEEALASQARTATEKRLVQDVYRRRGSASQVQAAVEADCVIEKQKEAEANALAIAAAKARGELREIRGETTEPSPSMSIPQPGADERAKQAQAAREENQRMTCASLNREMENLRSRERAGGSATTMEGLSNERRQLQGRLSSNGC